MDMPTNDQKNLIKIYENLNFKSSYEDYDPQIEKVKNQANEFCHSIEKKLSGTITFYKRAKNNFFNDPNDMNALQELEGIHKRLTCLAQYQEFRD
jgi:hypothetical protein